MLIGATVLELGLFFLFIIFFILFQKKRRENRKLESLVTELEAALSDAANRQGKDESGDTQTEDELQYKLMTIFVKDNKTRFSEIKRAIDAGDIKLAHRLTHTLKSNAGQLGRTLLQQAAVVVERQLNDGYNRVTPQQMTALEIELNVALAEFTMLLDELQYGTAEHAEPLDAESTLELIEKLELMLGSYNPECWNLIHDLRRIPGSEELIRLMDDLDFEPALVSLAELKKKIYKSDNKNNTI